MKARSALMALAALLLAGCFGHQKLTWQQKMDSSLGVERAQAVMVVGEQNMWSAIPQVIRRLEDDDVSVRLVAIRTLVEMTGRDFGYVAYGSERDRAEAVRRWQTWWETEGRRGQKTAAAAVGEKP